MGHKKSSIFLSTTGLNSWLAIGFLILSLGHSIWPRSGILAVSGLSLARKGVDMMNSDNGELQGYDDQMLQTQSNLEKEIIAAERLEELSQLADTNFDWELNDRDRMRTKRAPR